jgi:hypothetical protein
MEIFAAAKIHRNYSIFIIHYSLLNIHTLSRSVSKTEKAPQGGAFFCGGHRVGHSEAFSR